MGQSEHERRRRAKRQMRAESRADRKERRGSRGIREQRAMTREQRAESKEQRAESREQRAERMKITFLKKGLMNEPGCRLVDLARAVMLLRIYRCH
jgi:hypothetical protein